MYTYCAQLDLLRDPLETALRNSTATEEALQNQEIMTKTANHDKM